MSSVCLCVGCIVGAAFDSSVESSSSENANREPVGEMVTPVRPRTTEDLFAAIHRYVLLTSRFCMLIKKLVYLDKYITFVHGNC